MQSNTFRIFSENSEIVLDTKNPKSDLAHMCAHGSIG